MHGDRPEQEFDRYAEGYTAMLDVSLAISGYDSGYFDDYKVRLMFSAVRKQRQQVDAPSILNFGCGVGTCDQIIARYFPASRIYATDVSAESIRIARERNSSVSTVTYAVSDGIAVPFDGTFDIIYCAGVFHHIPPEQRQPILVGLRDKLAPGGRLFLFEHNPWNPLTRRVVASCPVDRNAQLISRPDCAKLLIQAGFTAISGSFIVFFPRQLRFLSFLEPFMGACPLGAQYCMVASRQGS